MSMTTSVPWRAPRRRAAGQLAGRRGAMGPGGRAQPRGGPPLGQARRGALRARGLRGNAIFVGEPSGSGPNFIGETIPFALPYSKALVNVADLYWQTSWPMDHRPWIAPELYAPPSFLAYSQNQDPAMDAVLSCREHLPAF